MRWITVSVLLGAALASSPALADPCKAIPDKGPPPSWIKPGAVFTGQVRYVGDGDSICISSSPDPRTWVEVRIADFYAPELNEPGGKAAKVAMIRVAKGRTVRCTVTRRGRVRSYDRVIATCVLNGRSLRDHMTAAGVREGGRGSKPLRP